MVDVTHVQQYGNQLKVLMSDGTSRIGYPTVGGLWIVSGAGGAVIDPQPPGPGGGTGTVIYPTTAHNVVDFDGSFVGHQSRTPPSVNPGCDYGVPVGTNVWAVAAGTVTDIDNNFGGSGGRLIHIDHNALSTSSDYLHMSRIDVSIGQVVTQGQVIGLSGASANGSETGVGAHLHISYRTAIDHMYTSFNNIDFDAYIKSLP